MDWMGLHGEGQPTLPLTLETIVDTMGPWIRDNGQIKDRNDWWAQPISLLKWTNGWDKATSPTLPYPI